jgi:hypothetical protein
VTKRPTTSASRRIGPSAHRRQLSPPNREVAAPASISRSR